MKHCQKILSLIPILFGIGCAYDTENASESVVAIDQAITNGTPVSTDSGFDSVIAVYHKEYLSSGYTWFPRPCSGVAINRGWVLTARHCVTQDGSPNGITIPETDVMLNKGASPGCGAPPAGSFGISQIHDIGSNLSRDIVLLEVGTDAPLRSNTTYPSLWSGTLSAGQMFVAFGFGQNATGTSYPDFGAGILRSANMEVSQVRDTDYGFNPNSLGQIVAQGDSGGPSFLRAVKGAAGYVAWPELIGIHKDTAYDTSLVEPFLRQLIGEIALFDRPMYRFWNPTVGDHFYYHSSVSPDPAWKYEVPAFRLAHPGTGHTTPLYRFYGGNHHFYTTNYSEGINAGFTYENVPGWIVGPDDDIGHANVVPLYRYYNPTLGDHFYTTTKADYGGWNYELIVGYVHTP